MGVMDYANTLGIVFSILAALIVTAILTGVFREVLVYFREKRMMARLAAAWPVADAAERERLAAIHSEPIPHHLRNEFYRVKHGAQARELGIVVREEDNARDIEDKIVLFRQREQEARADAVLRKHAADQEAEQARLARLAADLPPASVS